MDLQLEAMPLSSLQQLIYESPLLTAERYRKDTKWDRLLLVPFLLQQCIRFQAVKLYWVLEKGLTYQQLYCDSGRSRLEIFGSLVE